MTGPLFNPMLSLRQRVFRRFAPDIWTVTGIGFLNAAGFSISLPFLSLYLYQERGLSMTLVGTIFLVTGLCSAVAQMFGGVLSDRFGRRPLLLAGAATTVLLYLVMALLIAVSAPVLMIALSYVLGRAALMMMRPAISAIVADVTPKSRLTETYGLLRVGVNAGWAAGPAVGGYLAASLPYAWLFGVAALTGVITVGVILLFLKESFGGASERVRFRDMFVAGRDTSFLQFTLLSLLVFMVMGQMSSTLSVFTVDGLGFSTVQYGLLLTLNGVIVVLFQYPVARWLSRVTKPLALTAGSLLYAVGYFSVGWDTRFLFGLVSMTVISAGEIIYSPTSQTIVGELAPPDWRGRYMGFYGLSETLGMSFGPLLGGVLLDNFSGNHQFVWGAIAAVALAAAIGFHWWGATRRMTQGQRT